MILVETLSTLWPNCMVRRIMNWTFGVIAVVVVAASVFVSYTHPDEQLATPQPSVWVWK